MMLRWDHTRAFQRIDGCHSTATCIIMMFITTVHKYIERKEKKSYEKEENEECSAGMEVG